MITLPYWKHFKFPPNLFSTRMPKRKTEKLGSLSKPEKVSQNRLFSRGRAAYGFVRNFRKASGWSKKRRIFTNQDYVYNILSSNQKFPKISSFFKIYQRNLVYGIGICVKTKESNIYWLLLRFFLRFVRIQTMKTKYDKDILLAFKK